MWVAILEDDALFGSVARQPSSSSSSEGGGGGEEEDASCSGGEEEEGEAEGEEIRERGSEQEFLRRSAAAAEGEEAAAAAAAAAVAAAAAAAAAGPSSLLSPPPPPPRSAAPALPVDKSDPWEMVQGSSNLYPASAESKLRKEKGGKKDDDGSSSGKKTSKRRKKPKALAARVLEAVDSCPWPLSTEYAETGRYNHLVSAPFPPGDDTDDAVGRDIGRTFPEHPQVRFFWFLFLFVSQLVFLHQGLLFIFSFSVSAHLKKIPPAPSLALHSS